VPVLRRLNWGSFPYASLRYAPGQRLQWVCGNRTNDPHWSHFSCDWVGMVVRPQGMAPRKEGEVTAGHEDEWLESVELSSVSPLCTLFSRMGRSPLRQAGHLHNACSTNNAYATPML
jgi:hypothetical protein